MQNVCRIEIWVRIHIVWNAMLHLSFVKPISSNWWLVTDSNNDPAAPSGKIIVVGPPPSLWNIFNKMPTSRTMVEQKHFDKNDIQSAKMFRWHLCIILLRMSSTKACQIFPTELRERRSQVTLLLLIIVTIQPHFHQLHFLPQ